MFRRRIPSYFVEFRFQGYAKRYAHNMIQEVARKFRVTGVTSKKVVPHITIFGPFTTHNEKLLIKEFVKSLRDYELVPFKVKGFNSFDNPGNKVIYLDIEPSERMINLRRSLANNLLKVTRTKSPHDSKMKYYFHSTVAFKDIDDKFDSIIAYIKEQRQPEINQHLLRVTLLKEKKILYEYDLFQRRLLSRKEALNRKIFRKTIMILKSKDVNFENDFDKHLTLWEKLKERFWQ